MKETTNWPADLTVGIGFIDEDHRAMFASMQNLLSALANGKTEAANAALVDLVNVTCAHFEREERSMVANSYPHAAAHRADHARLIEQVSAIVERIRTASPPGLDESVAGMLWDWVTQHITTADRAYARYLREVGNTVG